jgi:hypothetical protein
MGAGRVSIVLPKISTPDQSASEALRLRVLAYRNGAPASEELRKKALKKKRAAA